MRIIVKTECTFYYFLKWTEILLEPSSLAELAAYTLN